MPHNDIDRLKREYARREASPDLDDLNSFLNPSYNHIIQQREREVLRQLGKNGINNLGGSKILEIGCGNGRSLLNFLRYGAQPTALTGIDLLFDRLYLAHKAIPAASLACADGQNLPYSSGTFDIIYQFTAFSSILDEGIRRNMASEILRVLKMQGLIIWYDFWWNPLNKQTRGIKPKEIKALFPNCEYSFRKITLAPPITRKLIPFSLPLTLLLESLKIFNTHFLVTINK